MGTVVLAGATSGSTTLSPTDAVTTVITLPSSTDTLVGKATTDTLTNKTLTAPVLSGSVTGTYTLAGTPTTGASLITSATAQASTSGTSIDFTSIPSWVKRITVMFNGVSLNGTSIILLQLGDSGGIETSGYTGGGNYMPGAGTVTLSTTGFGLMGLNPTASTFHDGFITLALQNSGTFTWVETGLLIRSDANMTNSAGAKSLSATLDRVRITTVNGTDTFDAGSINIMYE